MATGNPILDALARMQAENRKKGISYPSKRPKGGRWTSKQKTKPALRSRKPSSTPPEGAPARLVQMVQAVKDGAGLHQYQIPAPIGQAVPAQNDPLQAAVEQAFRTYAGDNPSVSPNNFWGF